MFESTLQTIPNALKYAKPTLSLVMTETKYNRKNIVHNNKLEQYLRRNLTRNMQNCRKF